MFRNVFLIVIFMPLVIFTNCKNTPKNTTSKQVEKSTQELLEFTILLSDSQSNFAENTKIIVTSEEDLKSIFARINSTRKPGIPVPEVDFNQYEVVFYAQGEVSHGVNGLQVASVVKNEEEVVVNLAAEKPQGKYVTTVMSQPCVMLQFKKQGLPVKVLAAKQAK